MLPILVGGVSPTNGTGASPLPTALAKEVCVADSSRQAGVVRVSYHTPLQGSTRLQVLLPSLSLFMGWISLKPWLLS
jgi:hypothetical protein